MSNSVNLVMGPIRFDVQYPFIRRQKYNVRVRFPKDEHFSSLFRIPKMMCKFNLMFGKIVFDPMTHHYFLY